MGTFVALIVVAAFGYFMYTKFKKNKVSGSGPGKAGGVRDGSEPPVSQP